MTNILSFLSALAAVQPTEFGHSAARDLATPVLTAAEFIIPAAVGVSGIHKLMEHRESAGSLLIELLTKGGGSILTIELIKAFSGLGQCATGGQC